MNKYFRYLASIKTAAIFDSVKSSLEQKGFKEEQTVKYSGKITIPGVLPGISVQVPDNPVDANGQYNVMVQIRPGANATKAGVRAILIICEAGGVASKENTDTFGNSDWLKKQLGVIQTELSKKFGKVSLKNLGLGSFSGGYQAVGNILSDPTINDKVNSVIVLDGIHYGKRSKPDHNGMKPWLQFAEKAKKDPTKKFVFVYTSVDPGSYASTSDSAKYLNENVGAKEVPVDQSKLYAGKPPSSISNVGGYTAIQLFPRKDENKPGYGYNEREQRMQHIQAAKSLPNIWNEYLNDWNK